MSHKVQVTLEFLQNNLCHCPFLTRRAPKHKLPAYLLAILREKFTIMFKRIKFW